MLGDFDDARRIGAARALRRLPPDEAGQALIDTIAKSRDEYARFRAFVLLTAFNDPRTPDVVRTALRDRNDRLREGAYAWLERHPDRALTDTLLAAIETEQGEFVRPSLIRAVVVLDASDRVRTTLVREIARGLDIYRSAVIAALGERRAAYAVEGIAAAAAQDGPLQDDAVMALGKIGGAKALQVLSSLSTKSPALTLKIATAICMAKDDCASHRDRLIRDAATARVADAAVSGLALLAARGDATALSALATAATTSKDVAAEAGIGMASVALKQPLHLLEWLVAQPAGARDAVIARLHEAFDLLEADLDEERFFASMRAAYWQAADASDARTVAAALIDKLEF